ncbi:pectate lyase [Parerythrobacter aurantius]|uniref:pectate lyase family protein n=1 Tax=Parerythrobacter aurantius TaxID=3127706 RepID=UPI0032528293
MTAAPSIVAVGLTLSACAQKVVAAPPGAPRPVAGERMFSGAIGYGAASLGGAGGKIIYVSNHNDAGPGSLRECLTSEGKRTCVFRVGGVFRFTTTPPIISDPYLTVAGQTAPGGGVVITHGGGSQARTPIVIKRTHDVIIRHVRIRLDRLSGNRESDDGITIEDSHDVIVDHVSASWASDELVNGFADNDRITISNSIFSYGIPRHDKCALLSSDPTDAQNVSFIGNICAHNGDRNPDINFPPGSCVEVINNVFYNAQSQFAEVWESYGGTPVSIVGNSFIGGPDTTKSAQGIVREIIGSTGPASIYLWQNAFSGSFDHVTASAKDALVENPPCPLTIAPATAANAYDSVLMSAGAWPRDSIDRTVVSDIRRGTGNIVERPGTFVAPWSEEAYPDQDRDGMDDRWERAHGADPKVADPWGNADKDAYSNFENFLADREEALRSAS